MPHLLEDQAGQQLGAAWRGFVFGRHRQPAPTQPAPTQPGTHATGIHKTGINTTSVDSPVAQSRHGQCVWPNGTCMCQRSSLYMPLCW